MNKTKITQEITVPTPDDTPAVVAFRVGQLEKRFDTFEAKLDNFGGNFVTIEFVKELKKEADTEHKAFDSRLAKLERLLSAYPIVQALVFGVAGLILIAVFSAIVALVVIKT